MILWPARCDVQELFALFGIVCYVLMLQAVAVRLRPALASSTVGSFYLHDPSRFRFGLTIAIAVLAGLGVEAWLRTRSRLDCSTTSGRWC